MAQAQALPVVMSGRDCIGVAKTGSGKTLAFVLPMLRHIKVIPFPACHHVTCTLDTGSRIVCVVITIARCSCWKLTAIWHMLSM